MITSATNAIRTEKFAKTNRDFLETKNMSTNETNNQPIVQKISTRSDPGEAGISLQPVQKREVVLVVDAESLDNMRKAATVSVEHPQGSTFRIICDEGPYLGGDDSAPPPLAYYSASIAFCLLTQLSRYAAIKKLKIKKMRLSQETRFSIEGSAIQGSLMGKGECVITHVDIESDEPEEAICEMLRVGQNSCFIMQSILHPVPATISANLNGAPLTLDSAMA